MNDEGRKTGTRAVLRPPMCKRRYCGASSVSLSILYFTSLCVAVMSKREPLLWLLLQAQDAGTLSHAAEKASELING